MDELTAAFTIDRIGKAGAKFDIHKAQWFNQQYLKAKSDEDLSGYLLESLKKEKIDCSKEKAIKICSVMKDRVTFPDDFWKLGKFFFEAPVSFDEQIVAKKWNEDAVKVLQAFRVEMDRLPVLTAEEAKAALEKATSGLSIATGKIMQALRVVLTGGASGPDLMMTMEIIGKQEVVKRIDYALRTLTVKIEP